MALRVGQASSSETFTKYGVAPNQRRTGVTAARPEGNLDGELNIINFAGNWECVYRPQDEGVADRIAEFVYRAVANGSHIGYSWSGNTQLFDALKKKKSTDPADVDTLVNTDCATLVGAAVYFAGIHDNGLRAMTTSKMNEVLMGTNAFNKLSSKELCQQGKGLRRGDILWRSGHTGVSLDTDPISYGVSLTSSGLKFTNASGATTGNYPSDVNMKGLVAFRKYTYSGINISAGTSGTRAVQRTRSVKMDGYKIIDARLAYVSNSELCNVVPFMGYGDETRLCVNFYRASGKAGTIDATVCVVYVREEVTL